MIVKFKNETIKTCTAPIEQKIFKNNVAIGWALLFSLIGNVTSEDVDVLLAENNINELIFSTNTETDAASVTISGYNKVASSTIRYSEDVNNNYVEIQLTKGV